jgi:cephalosporin hydroxylase
MIEIGIFNGGSLKMWKDYFGPKATIVGVDINPGCKKYEEPGIEIVIGDQADPKFLQELSNRYPNFSVVIDDGGHRMDQQITTLEELYLPMHNDGVYLCEDTHTSYMPAFGGGHQKLNTFIEYTKKLIDQLNAFHVEENEYLAQNYFTQATDSIHFYDSVVVIEKKSRTKPDQVVYGNQAEFTYVAPSLSGNKP